MDLSQVRDLNIPIVGDRHYWFVRTTGGIHYEDFIGHDYIAIGWDYISVEYFRTNSEDTVKRKIEQCEKELPAEASANDADGGKARKQAVTMIYNKVSRFVNEFQEGDVVLVPSKNSERLAIGVVISNVYEDDSYLTTFYKNNPNTEVTPCPYQKRRNVRWIKGLAKVDVDTFLAKALNAQHSISNIDEFAPLINRSIYNLYATENDIHAIIHAGHPNGMSLAELRELINTLDSGFKMGANLAGETYDPEKIDVKIAIHSPGILEICALIATSGLTISMLLFALSHYRHGGKAKGKFEGKIGPVDLAYEYDHESKGELDYKQEASKIDAQILENLLELEEKLSITYPDLLALQDVAEKTSLPPKS